MVPLDWTTLGELGEALTVLAFGTVRISEFAAAPDSEELQVTLAVWVLRIVGSSELGGTYTGIGGGCTGFSIESEGVPAARGRLGLGLEIMEP